MAPLLDIRALNRATLDRQLLLRRSDLTAAQAVHHLVGLQAQTPHTWYTGLWSRLADYTPQDTSGLLRDGGLARMALMRSTIHLVTADDCLWLRPLVDPVIERSTTSAFKRAWGDVDLAAVAAMGRELPAEGPLTFSALGRGLAERWPDRDPAALAQAVRAYVPLVQVPPRGLWGTSGPVAHTSVENWLGRPVDPAAEAADLVLRYLAAFGPATVRDVQKWCGLTRLAEVLDGLRPRLMVFRDATGRELFDLPDAPRPAPDTPAPARFLYDFDNLLLSHVDRGRVVDANRVDYTAQDFFTGSPEQPSSVLIDGFVAATWRIRSTREGATLRIRPFRALTGAEEEDLVDEGTRLLAFTAPGAATREITIEAPVPG